MSGVEREQNYSASTNYLNQDYYFSGSDVSCYVNNIWLDELAYLQMTPKQQVTPIYSVFQRTPVNFIAGNYLVQGVMGFNFVYANYLEQLINDFNQQSGINTVTQMAENVIYIEEMKVVFNNNIRPVESIITVHNMYVTGGVINPSVDGNPVQYVYSFVAANITKKDLYLT